MQDDDRYTDAEVREGEDLFARFLADLTERGELPPVAPAMSNPLGYMRVDNIQALIVQKRGGGWVADVLFRNVPDHCPETMGTPEANPFGTRRAAMRAGKDLVRQFLKAPVPPELVAWMIMGRPECGLPMLIKNQMIFSDYRA